MNIFDPNNRGFLALKLNRAAGKKGKNATQIAKEIDLSQPTISAVLRGAQASMSAYTKVAEYLGVPMKPEKSVITKIPNARYKVPKPVYATLEEQMGGYGSVYNKHEDGSIEHSYNGEVPKKLTKETLERIDAKAQEDGQAYPGKKLTKEDIVLAERETMYVTTNPSGGMRFTNVKPRHITTLPAPIVQNEFTRWQAWVIMALQVVMILFLIFPVK